MSKYTTDIKNFKKFLRKTIGRPKKLKSSDIPNLLIFFKNTTKKVDKEFILSLITKLRVIPSTVDFHMTTRKTEQLNLKMIYKDAEKLHITKLFMFCSEIAYSLEILYRVPVYLSYFPKQTRNTDKYTYVSYHWENYLNEIYKIRERICSLIGFVKNDFKKKKLYSKVKSAVELKEYVVNSFDGLMRGRHTLTHETRLEDSLFRLLQIRELVLKCDKFLRHGKSTVFSEDKFWIFDELPNMLIWILNKYTILWINVVFGRLNKILGYR